MWGPGTTLGGRFRLVERLGGGSMGEVWGAVDEVLGRTVAVKVILPALLADEGFARRFRAEARVMAMIGHPGVIDVYDYGEESGPGGRRTAYLVMELISGPSLADVLRRDGVLAPERAMEVVAQAASALQAVHDQGVVHRDVKPSNLMMREDGSVVLTDFGIARSAQTAAVTGTGMVLGSAPYLAPEAIAAGRAVPATDQYALGILAYQCLTGRVPFEAENTAAILYAHVNEILPPLPGDLPSTVREVVVRALAKNPDHRWGSASEMAAAASAAGSVPSRAADDETAVHFGSRTSADDGREQHGLEKPDLEKPDLQKHRPEKHGLEKHRSEKRRVLVGTGVAALVLTIVGGVIASSGGHPGSKAKASGGGAANRGDIAAGTQPTAAGVPVSEPSFPSRAGGPAATYTGIAGPGCASPGARYSELGAFAQGTYTGWYSEKSGWRVDVCTGADRFIPETGTAKDSGSHVEWVFKTDPVQKGACRVDVHIPRAPGGVADVGGGATARYKVLTAAAHTPAQFFEIQQAAHVDSWVAAGSFQVGGGTFGVWLVDRGIATQGGLPHPAHFAADVVRITCTST